MAAMFKQCPNCNVWVPTGKRVCAGCGTQFEGVPEGAGKKVGERRLCSKPGCGAEAQGVCPFCGLPRCGQHLGGPEGCYMCGPQPEAPTRPFRPYRETPDLEPLFDFAKRVGYLALGAGLAAIVLYAIIKFVKFAWYN